MNRTTRNLILIIGVIGVFYLVSSTTVSTAQDDAHAVHKTHKTLTIALDATVVKVSLTALEKAGVNTAELSFGSLPPDKIASLLADKKLARVIGGVGLTVADGQSGRVIMDKNEQVTTSDGEDAKHKFITSEAKMVLEAECRYEDRDIVAVEFSFDASMEEKVSSAADKKGKEIVNSTDLDVNTAVYLHTGQPKIVAALKGKQDATILILRATIQD